MFITFKLAAVKYSFGETVYTLSVVEVSKQKQNILQIHIIYLYFISRLSLKSTNQAHVHMSGSELSMSVFITCSGFYCVNDGPLVIYERRFTYKEYLRSGSAHVQVALCMWWLCSVVGITSF